MDTMVAYYFLKPQLLPDQWKRIWTTEGHYMTGSEICRVYGITPKNPNEKEMSFIESEYRKWNWKMEQHHDAQNHNENPERCDCAFNGPGHKRAWEKYSDDKRDEWTLKMKGIL